MSHFLFFQPFLQGTPSIYSRAKLLALLGPHGEADLDENDGDPSFRFAPDTFASSAYLVGDGAENTRCLTLARPYFTEELRLLAFQILDHLGGFVFDGELGCIYHVHGSAADLPTALRDGCSGMLYRVAAPQQLWPAMHAPPPPRNCPALVYGNQEDARLLLLDRINPDGKTLELDMSLCPEACNPATLGGVNNLLLRLRSAHQANPDYPLRLCFSTNEAALQLLESRTMPQGLSATIVTPGEQLFGDGDTHPRFVAQQALFRAQMEKGQTFLEQAAKRFGAAPAMNAGGAARFDSILEQIHQLYIREQQDKPVKAYSKAAANWAELAGFALGEAIRLENGGQWGLVERGCGLRWPAVQFGDGTLCFPLNHALNRIITGSEYAITAWFARFAPQKHDGFDYAGYMMLYVDLLLGATFPGFNLPLAEQVPRQQLDFTVESLQALDRFAQSAGPQLQQLPAEAQNTMVTALGAYMGEVIRRNAIQHWQWRNYADYFAGREPSFPWEPLCAVLLENDSGGYAPLQGAAMALIGHDSLMNFALQVEPELAGQGSKAGSGSPSAAADSTQRTPDQQAYRERRMLQLAPVLVYAFVCGAEEKQDRKEQQALFDEMHKLAQMENAFGAMLKEALPNIVRQRESYLEDPWRSILDEQDTDQHPLQTLGMALRECCNYIDARHDEMQARYVRRRLYNLGNAIAEASGGGFLRSAISRHEKKRLEFLKEILAC